MVTSVRNLKSLLISTLGCVVLSACSQSHHMYEQEAYASTQVTSRYGYAASTSQTTEDCAYEVHPCGFMRVVPVYPIYQIVTPIPAEPVIESPVISVPEPTIYVEEPEPYIEPELPVYVPPTQHWPEPETPAPSWTPLRK